MNAPLTPDLCVVGAGSGGLSVAAAAAGFGVPVVLIERGRMGGDCLNTGCVPSKALIAAAKRAQAIADAPAFGVNPAACTVDFAAVMAHVRSAIAAIAPNDSAERFTGLGVRVISGAARFVDRDTIAVGETRVRARRFVLATGSSPAVPDIPGLAGTPYLTNETLFDLREQPEHLIVIGAGPIGLEMAQAFRRLGSQVTVLEAASPLGRDDPEAVAVVLAQLAADGVDIRQGVRVRQAAYENAHFNLTLDGHPGTAQPITGSHLLVAAGRRAETAGLNLEAVGIRTDARGICVDKGLRTDNRRVYAIGDAVSGGPQFTHVANDQAGLVIRNALFRLPINARNRVTPRVTFTDPELAQVGLSEAEARAAHAEIRILRWPFADNDRAQTDGQTDGFVKLVATKRGRILGATIVGAHAGELIATWTLAVSQGLRVSAPLGVAIAYPTLAEAGKRAALQYYTPGLTNPWVRRIIAALRLLG